MSVHIRLARAGTKKRPFYRLVVTDHRSPRGGRFLENIGTFDPRRDAEGGATLLGEGATPGAADGLTKDAETLKGAGTLRLDAARLFYWRGVGAQPSDTVERILKKFGVRAPKAA
jgi:small subunit ribosomal protein S16